MQILRKQTATKEVFFVEQEGRIQAGLIDTDTDPEKNIIHAALLPTRFFIKKPDFSEIDHTT